MNFSLSLGQDSKDWIDYFSAISPFLIGVFTLGFYFWNANILVLIARANGMKDLYIDKNADEEVEQFFNMINY